MLSRWFFLAIVGVALVTYMHRAEDSDAVAANITQSCSAAVPGAATVTFGWQAPAAGAQQTWFDISLAPGFLPGWFKGYGPLPATQTAYAIDGVPQGLRFYYRMNTLYTTGWRESASGSFISGCGGGGGGGGYPPATGAVMQSCDGAGKVTAVFTWQANAQGSQWIDLSLVNNGFAPGSFVGVGPLASGVTQFTWYGLAKNSVHYWRVNTLTGSGWMSSNTGSFATLTCLAAMKACVGYMAGYSASGRAECDQVIAGTDANRSACVAGILKVGGNADACVKVGGEPYLNDCLLGLTGRSHFGMTSCRLYYSS